MHCFWKLSKLSRGQTLPPLSHRCSFLQLDFSFHWPRSGGNWKPVKSPAISSYPLTRDLSVSSYSIQYNEISNLYQYPAHQHQLQGTGCSTGHIVNTSYADRVIRWTDTHIHRLLMSNQPSCNISPFQSTFQRKYLEVNILELSISLMLRDSFKSQQLITV